MKEGYIFAVSQIFFANEPTSAPAHLKRHHKRNEAIVYGDKKLARGQPSQETCDKM